MSRTSSAQQQQQSHSGGSGHSYYLDDQASQQQRQHLAPRHSMLPGHPGYHPQSSAYHDPRMYHSHFEQPPSGSEWQGDYPPSAGGPSRLPIPHPSRDLYAGYPPSQHPQRSSPGLPPGTPRQIIEGWPGSQHNAPPHTMPPLQRPNSRHDPRSVSVKLEDLVSHDRRSGSNASRGPGGFTSVPLGSASGQGEAGGSAQQQPPKSAGGGMTAGAGGSGAAGAEAAGPAGPSEFIKKLYKMLEEESTAFAAGQGRGRMKKERGSVGWARGGSSFVVWDMNDFTTKILPQTFRHSNFSSFVRQLNKYGFSKIKHVDEETGQIRENIWEFQHPNFQAGGKADLETIKRKAVASKKTDTEIAQSPARPIMAEDTSRLQEMESRVQGLEEQLVGALEDVRQARMREQGVIALMREMLSHLSAAERGAAASSAGTPASDVEPSAHMMHMWQLYEQVASATPIAQPSFGYSGYPPPPAHSSMPQQFPSYAHLAPLSGLANAATQIQGQVQPSPSFDDRDKTTPPSRSSASDRPAVSFSVATQGQGDPRTSTSSTSDHAQAMTGQNGLPVYAETPAWLTEGVTAPMPMYHRKSSDGIAFRLMMDALGQGNGAGYGEEGQDPLEIRPPSAQQTQGQSQSQTNGNTIYQQSFQPQQQQQPQQTSQPGRPAPIIQSSPFGTLIIPPESSVHPNAQNKGKTSPKTKSKSSTTTNNNNKEIIARSRQSSIIKPHWNKTPRILVVEDDVVYRQLSSKFLEKFGCVVETVENAQEAIEKMNQTKYDLVLMDIFFGPSMDGRKATSLIRQFDMYTPIISMTSNAQPQDVDSYLQSGMNDILAKPFTKHGLFGILDKHLLHMKVLQLSAEVPRSVGVPPLSDQGVLQAVADGAATIRQGMWGGSEEMRNPLAAMGWSDDTYQIVLNQYLQSGMMPDINNINFYDGQPMITNTTSAAPNLAIGFNGNGTNGTNGSGSIGTNVVFGDFNNRKRSLELAADEAWSQAGGVTPMMSNGQMGEATVASAVNESGQENGGKRQGGKKDNKRAKR